MLIFLTAALAGSYHPSDVAMQSDAFRQSSDQLGAAARDAQSRSRAIATALRRFEEGLDLLADAEPSGQRDRLAALEKQYNRDFAEVQRFADVLVGDFDSAFKAALSRALVAHQGAVRCRAEVADGPKLPGMRQRTRANPDCSGPSLNIALAAAIDADAQLRVELEEIAQRQWPVYTEDSTPVAATGGSRWVEVSGFFRAAVGDRLRSIDRLDEEARLPFEVAIEQGADTDALKKLRSQAEQVDAQTRSRRASLAAPALARAQVLFAKLDPPAGWCAQPVLLGGCVGQQDDGLLEVLLGDKKLDRALDR